MAASRSVPEINGMESAIQRAIRAIPRGKVATYGQVAEAAGYPSYHRQVAQVLRKYGDMLPWHRVLGSGGVLKVRLGSALEQRFRLEMEGVHFRGSRVDMAAHAMAASERSKAPRRRT